MPRNATAKSVHFTALGAGDAGSGPAAGLWFLADSCQALTPRRLRSLARGGGGPAAGHPLARGRWRRAFRLAEAGERQRQKERYIKRKRERKREKEIERERERDKEREREREREIERER